MSDKSLVTQMNTRIGSSSRTIIAAFLFKVIQCCRIAEFLL